MSKHTPPPWRWDSAWDDPAFDLMNEQTWDKYMDIALRGPGGRPIIPITIDHYEMIIDDLGVSLLTPENRALIAEAPNLLAALKCVVAALGQPETYPADVALARKAATEAIAKAEGEAC